MTKENKSPAATIRAAQQKAADSISEALQAFHDETGLIPERIDFSVIDARCAHGDPAERPICIGLVEVLAKTF